MYDKFIITLDGEIRFGRVFLHVDLLPPGDDDCHGGGLWKVDNERGCIILYGRSFDFGLPDFGHARWVNREVPPGSLGYPMFYQRNWADEEVLEPVKVNV